NLDRQVREQTGGASDLASYTKEQGMRMSELQRRARIAILRERVARARICERDPTRPKEKVLPEDTVTVVINEMFAKTEVEYDRGKLPEGIVARVGR
ncbi:MAG: hypothetical protein HC813_03295, partial [Planctomycetes bacterium]|nr:hypothetical protein [Planctomycetota bacterium]